MELINRINAKYVQISNRVTKAYTKAFGLLVDVYKPIFPVYEEDLKYEGMVIFAPHQAAQYNKKPDKSNVPYYIPHLIKAQNFNSSEYEFDNMSADESDLERPYIETTKKRELPIQTKIVVKQGKSISKYFIDKKLVVTGANGFMLLRMYLSPLTKDNDNTDEPQQEEFIPTQETTSSGSLTMNIPED